MSIWERCEREGRSLNEIVSAYAAAGDARELATVLQRGEDERASALYVIAELPTAVSRPIWRCALGHVADADERTAFSALDIFHSFLMEAEGGELLAVLRSTNYASSGLFTKLFAIVRMAPAGLIASSRDLAREQGAGAHSAGLAMLVGDTLPTSPEISLMLKSADLVTRFYGCCAVGRHPSRYRALQRLLPAPVRRRLLLHIGG